MVAGNMTRRLMALFAVGCATGIVAASAGTAGLPTGPRIAAARLGRGAQPPARRIAPRTVDRLTIGEFYFGEELDRYYNSEYPRLERLCTGRPDFHACRQRNLRPLAKRLARVHVAPSSDSAVAGELDAVLGFHPQFDLGYRIEFRPVNGERARVWLESAGDWGYGIEVPGVRRSGGWIQLFADVLPAQSWIRADSAEFHGEATPLVDALVTLQPLPARYPDGSTRRILPGSYLITQVQDAGVQFREEVAADMPCGEDVKPPDVMPPTLEARPADLFARDGTPLFSLTYSRGC